VTTIAGAGAGAVDGSGAAARFLPQGGAVRAGTRLLVSDPGNFRVRVLDCGGDMAGTTVRTLAGGDVPGAIDGPGASARLGLPLGLAVGPDGRVYVADGANGAVRVITP
jgi:DNA-binding beta-propeller fold protein YncE